MQLVMSPSEIQSPSGQRCPFMDALGRSEWEEVAARLVIAAQKAGQWVAFECQGGRFRREAAAMVQEGLLKKEADGYLLTDLAKLKLSRLYPQTGGPGTATRS